MTIDADFRPDPVPPVNQVMQFLDPRTGRLTDHAMQLLAAWRSYSLGCSRIIACEAVFAANLYTLTPRAPTPIIEKYCAYDGFAFEAPSGSTGAVTATVVVPNGSLATLKVYKTNGAAQAGNTDIVAASFYIAFFVPSLDAAAGGFVLK